MKTWEKLGGSNGGLDAWAQWFRIEACLNLGGISVISRASLVTQMIKSPPTMQIRSGFDPWIREIPWRREWQPTPVFSTGKSHGQRSLVGYSPWGSQKVKSDWATNFFFCNLKEQNCSKRKKKPTWWQSYENMLNLIKKKSRKGRLKDWDDY